MSGGKKRALLIGNGRFADARLARLFAPTEDVAALKHVLLDPEIGGFDSVDVLTDQPLVPVRRAIAELCGGQSPNDLLLLYYTGHGVLSIDNDFYLALHETTVENPEADGLEADWLRKRMDRCRAKRQVLVLDCCHSGAFMAGRKDAGARAVTAETFGEGRYVLTASDAQSFAWDSRALKTGPEGTEGKTSLFTRLLVEGLTTGAAAPDKDTVSVHDLYTYARGNLPADAPGMSPQIFVDRGEGDLVLARNPAARFRLKSDILEALSHDDFRIRIWAVSEVETILTSPEPRRALAAREALRRRLESERDVLVYKRIEAALDQPGAADHPHPDPLPPAGEGAEKGVPLPPAGEGAEKGSPLPPAGEGARAAPTIPSPAGGRGRGPRQREGEGGERQAPAAEGGGRVRVEKHRPAAKGDGDAIAGKAKKPASPKKSLPEPKNEVHIGVDPRELPNLAVFKDIDAPWCPEMVIIPSGFPSKFGFRMSAFEYGAEGDVKTGPNLSIRVVRRFAVCRFPITSEQFRYFCVSANRKYLDDKQLELNKRPIVNVSWHDAKAFAEWLSGKTRHLYRLPSESEWEYACRSGLSANEITDAFNKVFDSISGYPKFQPSADFFVDSIPANPWGLSRMYGGVWEWCEDHWHGSYVGAPTDGNPWIDPALQADAPRAVRGAPQNIFRHDRIYRRGIEPTKSGLDLGFRCVRVLET